MEPRGRAGAEQYGQSGLRRGHGQGRPHLAPKPWSKASVGAIAEDFSVTALGTSPPRENARVAAEMWGGADSFERWPRDAI